MGQDVFFSFKEEDRKVVLTVKGRAVNPYYANLDFSVREVLKRAKLEDETKIKETIINSFEGISRTIVFVGKKTHKSCWIPCEVQMTLDQGKPVHAIFLKGNEGAKIPKCLSDNTIYVYRWSEARLQQLATR